MVCHPVRFALLIGAITAVAVSSARADDCCAPCAPTTKTITCTEMVKEAYTVKRTVNKVECKTEEYETTRCVMVPVTVEKEVKVMKRVPVVTEQVRKVCKNVVEYQDKTVMKKTYQNVQETVMKKHLKCLGHYECKEVPVHNMNLGSFLHHDNGCNTGCDNGCSTCAPACPQTKTVKHWVFAPEYECTAHTVCKKVCVECPTVCKVAVCKQVVSEETVKVCTYNCVEEIQKVKCTVCERHEEKVKATRTVRVCVPHEEEVTCYRMVPHTVNREVAVNNCATSSCSTCNTSCSTCDSSSGHSFLGGLFAGHSSCGCK